jgi:hypothetical protein
MNHMSAYAGSFSLTVDRETFNAKVIPWLSATLGNKRGKKKDWAAEEAPEISQRDLDRENKSWKLKAAIQKGYWCKVTIKHARDAIAFLCEWGDYCKSDSHIYGKLSSKSASVETVEGHWHKIAHMVRWMKRNVHPYSWSMAGSFQGKYNFTSGNSAEPLWEFYLAGDDAKIAFLMLKPS